MKANSGGQSAPRSRGKVSPPFGRVSVITLSTYWVPEALTLRDAEAEAPVKEWGAFEKTKDCEICLCGVTSGNRKYRSTHAQLP